MTKAELLQALRQRNANDQLEYDLDPADEILTVKWYGVKDRYRLHITERDSFCILRLTQISLGSHVQCHINAFLIQKLSTQPIPYCATDG